MVCTTRFVILWERTCISPNSPTAIMTSYSPCVGIPLLVQFIACVSLGCLLPSLLLEQLEQPTMYLGHMQVFHDVHSTIKRHTSPTPWYEMVCAFVRDGAVVSVVSNQKRKGPMHVTSQSSRAVRLLAMPCSSLSLQHNRRSP